MSSPAEDPLANALPSVHEGVRKSALIRALHDQLAVLPPGAFPFAAEFGRLRDQVAPQIGDTRVLFPEFTPHDEEHHVVQLFQLADRLFGQFYRNLRAVELFLLASALYAHDWGMAVGRAEIDWLKDGAPTPVPTGVAPLPDEAERLTAFARAEGLRPAADGRHPGFSDEQLRLYVRQTHARRSAARVKALFEAHPALGQALAHLCEGHWHEFATLDDPQRFPRDYLVLGETAQLLALTLQVRLIDLFHLTDDRTPYALWRFVSPRDRRSELEWRKHRALHGVSAQGFPPGRTIRVQGFTEDEEVWAGLQDLRRYCEEQVAHTLDLSARHCPQRYGLDFLRLDWAVTTGTLRPVDFSFSFDRGAVFRILSEDIYEGEREVFLRELLQNAIDALRTRRALWQQRSAKSSARRRPIPPFDTTIYFRAEHQEDGDIRLTCRDFGIGMDEHIVRNYFSVAGVSYYRSPELEREALGFEPVSRFGIGILSCFMVADAIEVRTYRDPDFGPPMATADLQLPGAEAHWARRLEIKVPAVDRQFIVKDAPQDFDVGTEVSLLVLSRRVGSDQDEGAAGTPATEPDGASEAPKFFRRMAITEYLCEIAGFVEFPIFVEERWPGRTAPRLTLILHPDQDPQAELGGFPDGTEVHQLSRDYPWASVLAPESLALGRELLTEYRFELKELLSAEGYEGWVSYPASKEHNIRFGARHIRDGGVTASSSLIPVQGESAAQGHAIYWAKQAPPEDGSNTAFFRVYRDGLLLRDIRRADRLMANSSSDDRWITTLLPRPLVLINLPSRRSERPNVARTTLIESERTWDLPIWAAIAREIATTEETPTLKLPPRERLLRLGWLMTVFPLSMDEINAMVPAPKRVRLWLTDPGRFEFREGLTRSELTCAIPETLSRAAVEQAPRLFDETLSASGVSWRGLRSIFASSNLQLHHSPTPALAALGCAAAWTHFIPQQLQFLRPPRGMETLLIQPVGRVEDQTEASADPWLRRVRTRNVAARKGKGWARETTLLKCLRDEPENLTERDLADALDLLEPRPVNFAPPFQAHVGTEDMYGEFQWLNLAHPLGPMLMRCLAAVELAIREQRLKASAAIEYQQYFGTLSYKESAARLFSFVEKHCLIESFREPETPDALTMVPKLPGDDSGDDWYFGLDKWAKAGPFGQVITTWPLPDLDASETGEAEPEDDDA